MISILILTLNEEANLPGCLESVAWSDDVVVFDSFSTDRTVEIARAAGAWVVQRQFDNWSAHQSWAVETLRSRIAGSITPMRMSGFPFAWQGSPCSYSKTGSP
jgi:hypothetical protein